MWVSGSRTSSSTWRSISVSAPTIASAIGLPSSFDRSRTRRGSLLQAEPIGCMRVFITPSCRSDVICERRCTGAAKIGSLPVRLICRSWLRVSTSSLTRVIRFSSTPTDTRMVCVPRPASAACGSAGGTGVAAASPGRAAAAAGAGAAGAGTGGCMPVGAGTAAGTGPTAWGSMSPASRASSVAMTPASSPGGSMPDAARAPTMAFITSAARRTAVTRAGVAAIVSSRTRPSTFSAACATRSSRGRPRKPQVPLMVCTRRKMSPTVARSPGVRSRVSSASSSAARLSLASIRNSDSRSSMGGPS